MQDRNEVILVDKEKFIKKVMGKRFNDLQRPVLKTGITQTIKECGEEE